MHTPREPEPSAYALLAWCRAQPVSRTRTGTLASLASVLLRAAIGCLARIERRRPSSRR
jgi:hypothetical protein